MKNYKNTLTAGILHSSQIYTYRTKDGRAYFSFSYVWTSGGYYQINIHKTPNYNGRSDSSSVAHWLSTSSNGASRKICFHSGKEPKSLDITQKFSTHWAELTWKYICTGVTIDQQFIRTNN